jgi:2-oxoglutarate ferredoxin oxidoreductase subunit alpha
MGITTEDPEIIAKMQEKRQKKEKAIIEQMKGMHTVNVFGDKGPVIMTYGSTTMSVLEALKVGGIEAIVVQPIYLEPFPVWEFEKYRDKQTIVVEQSCEGQFAMLLEQRVNIHPKTIIKKYDGRAFDPVELAAKIKEAS